MCAAVAPFYFLLGGNVNQIFWAYLAGCALAGTAVGATWPRGGWRLGLWLVAPWFLVALFGHVFGDAASAPASYREWLRNLSEHAMVLVAACLGVEIGSAIRLRRAAGPSSEGGGRASRRGRP